MLGVIVICWGCFVTDIQLYVGVVTCVQVGYVLLHTHTLCVLLYATVVHAGWVLLHVCLCFVTYFYYVTDTHAECIMLQIYTMDNFFYMCM